MKYALAIIAVFIAFLIPTSHYDEVYTVEASPVLPLLEPYTDNLVQIGLLDVVEVKTAEIATPQTPSTHQEWMAAAGIALDQQPFAEILIQRESSWNPESYNSSSGACSLVQALPCSKIPGDWRNPADALSWGNVYVASRYGSWQNALNHSYEQGWY